MEAVTKALEDMKGLYQKVVGEPAPDFGPSAYVPFPAGVDPTQHALLEAQHCAQLSNYATLAPHPGTWFPPADSFVKKDEYIIQLGLPGVAREDLKVFVISGELVIRGERKPLEKAADYRPISIERPWGPFERRFVLPVGSRVDELKASYVEGTLELRVPVTGMDVPKEHDVEVK